MRRNHVRFACVAAALAAVSPSAATGQSRQTAPTGREIQVASFNARLPCEWVGVNGGVWVAGVRALHARNTLAHALPAGTRLAYSYRTVPPYPPNAQGVWHSGESVVQRPVPRGELSDYLASFGQALNVTDCNIAATYATR